MALYEQTRVQAGAILGNLQGLVSAREAQSSIIADSEPLRRGLEEVQDKLSTQTGLGISSLTTLTAPSLRIGLSGSGNMELTANAADVSTSISGSGNVRLNGRTTSQNVRLSGAGNYRAFELPSAEATATLSGSGNIEVRAANTLRADLSGSGDVRYRGQPRVSSTVTGSGRVVDSN